MSENEAREVIAGSRPLPEDMTVEQAFLDAHIIVNVVTPF